MIGKGSKLYSIRHFKCPHCQEGDFFVSNNPYDLSQAGDLLDACPVCQRKYSPEPGFYYGAMYVAYGLAVALFVTIYVAINVLFPEAPPWVAVTSVLASLMIFGPLLYALSKIMYANLFLAYKGVARTAKEKEDALARSGKRA